LNENEGKQKPYENQREKRDDDRSNRRIPLHRVEASLGFRAKLCVNAHGFYGLNQRHQKKEQGKTKRKSKNCQRKVWALIAGWSSERKSIPDTNDRWPSRLVWTAFPNFSKFLPWQ
jgi:hypothetical protein